MKIFLGKRGAIDRVRKITAHPAKKKCGLVNVKETAEIKERRLIISITKFRKSAIRALSSTGWLLSHGKKPFFPETEVE